MLFYTSETCLSSSFQISIDWKEKESTIGVYLKLKSDVLVYQIVSDMHGEKKQGVIGVSMVNK